MKIALTLISLFLSSSLFASTWTHWVHLKASDSQTRTKISQYIHIDQVIDDSVYAVVNEHDFGQLKKNLSHLFIETHPYKEILPTVDTDEYEFPKGDEKFHTYKEVQNGLKALVRKYPKLAEEISIGNSWKEEA